MTWQHPQVSTICKRLIRKELQSATRLIFIHWHDSTSDRQLSIVLMGLFHVIKLTNFVLQFNFITDDININTIKGRPLMTSCCFDNFWHPHLLLARSIFTQALFTHQKILGSPPSAMTVTSFMNEPLTLWLKTNQTHLSQNFP